jgi:hypothetical protein
MMPWPSFANVHSMWTRGAVAVGVFWTLRTLLVLGACPCVVCWPRELLATFNEIAGRAEPASLFDAATASVCAELLTSGAALGAFAGEIYMLHFFCCLIVAPMCRCSLWPRPYFTHPCGPLVQASQCQPVQQQCFSGYRTLPCRCTCWPICPRRPPFEMCWLLPPQ